MLCLQAAVTSEGSLYTWGRNRGSCLGLGTRQSQDQPFPLQVTLTPHPATIHPMTATPGSTWRQGDRGQPGS